MSDRIRQGVGPASPVDAGAARRYEYLLLLILFLSFGFVFFDRQALFFLAPYLIRDFGLSNAELGALSGVLALTWALSGMFSGRLSDRLGSRKPILVAAVLLFSCFSSASGLMTGFVGLLVARALMGVAEGAVLPVSQSLMVEASREHRRGLNMGLVQSSSAGLLGGIIAPLVVVWLAEHLGWRTAFFVTIVPGVLLALWIWRAVREVPPGGPALTTATDSGPAGPAAPERAVPGTEHEAVPGTEHEAVPGTEHEAVPGTEHEAVPGIEQGVGTARDGGGRAVPTFWEVVKRRNVVLCVLIACFYLTWFIVIITFTPIYLTSVKGFSPSTMSAVMTCFGVAWVVWGFLTPAVSDRIGRRPSMIGFTLVAAICPVAVVYVPNPVLLGAIVVLSYTGLGCFTLFMATIPAETVPRGALATALGLVMGVGELAGGFVAPVIAGWASDVWGLRAAMFIAAGGAVVVVALSFGLRETAPSVLRRRAVTAATR